MSGIAGGRGIAGEDSGSCCKLSGEPGGAGTQETGACCCKEDSRGTGRDPQGSGGSPDDRKNFFESITSFFARRRTFFLLVASLILLIFAKPTVTTYIVGVVLVLAGQAVRFWSSGYIAKCDDLAVTGPYSMMRNPLYVGTFLIACGYSVMTNSGWIVWASVIAMFYATHGSAVMWEERFLRVKFAETYQSYCGRVPRWFPRIPARGTFGGGHVSWAQVKKNNEHKNFLGTLIVMIIFGVKLFVLLSK